MFQCNVCHVVLGSKDAQVRGVRGNCICRQCYAHIAGSEKPMIKPYRRQLTRLLSQLA